MAEILIVKPNVLSADDKAALRDVGVVAIEVEQPDEVRFVRAEQELDGGDLALAAMKALAKSSGINSEHLLFTKLIGEALAERKQRAAVPAAQDQGEGNGC
jgi:hypothetical protein